MSTLPATTRITRFGCYKPGDPAIPPGATQVGVAYPTQGSCTDKCPPPTTPPPTLDPDLWYCVERGVHLGCTRCGPTKKMIEIKISNFDDPDDCCDSFKGTYTAELKQGYLKCETGWIIDGKCPPPYGDGTALNASVTGTTAKVYLGYGVLNAEWSGSLPCEVVGSTSLPLTSFTDPYNVCPNMPDAIVEVRIWDTGIPICDETPSSMTYFCVKGDDTWWNTHPLNTCLDELTDGELIKYRLTGETSTSDCTSTARCDGQEDVWGACCDTYMWYCYECYEDECMGDFTADATCEEIECEAPVGRCCYLDGNNDPQCIDEISEEDCYFQYGGWGGWTLNASCPCP